MVSLGLSKNFADSEAKEPEVFPVRQLILAINVVNVHTSSHSTDVPTSQFQSGSLFTFMIVG